MVKILLDNGHGYDTPGKRSPIWPDGSQLFEWEFNRDIVSRIEILLKKAGISCVRLVPEKEDISLSERCKRANTIAKQSDCLLISIHANAGGGSGGEVFTYSGSHKSKSYAEIFRDLWKNHFPELRFRHPKTARLPWGRTRKNSPLARRIYSNNFEAILSTRVNFLLLRHVIGKNQYITI